MQGHIVLKPSDFVYSTVSTTSMALTAPVAAVRGAIITIENADVRMRYDGVAPVAGAGGGQKMAQNSVWEIEGRDILVAMRFIRDAGTDAIVSANYIIGE